MGAQEEAKRDFQVSFSCMTPKRRLNSDEFFCTKPKGRLTHRGVESCIKPKRRLNSQLNCLYEAQEEADISCHDCLVQSPSGGYRET